MLDESGNSKHLRLLIYQTLALYQADFPEKFKEFSKRYIAELKDDSDDIKKIKDLLKSHNVTLLYGAKDTKYNQAVVLQKYLEKIILK